MIVCSVFTVLYYDKCEIFSPHACSLYFCSTQQWNLLKTLQHKFNIVVKWLFDELMVLFYSTQQLTCCTLTLTSDIHLEVKSPLYGLFLKQVSSYLCQTNKRDSRERGRRRVHRVGWKRAGSKKKKKNKQHLRKDSNQIRIEQPMKAWRRSFTVVSSNRGCAVTYCVIHLFQRYQRYCLLL